jgi:hypothetical protein
MEPWIVGGVTICLAAGAGLIGYGRLSEKAASAEKKAERAMEDCKEIRKELGAYREDAARAYVGRDELTRVTESVATAIAGLGARLDEGFARIGQRIDAMIMRRDHE